VAKIEKVQATYRNRGGHGRQQATQRY
jgi:hypothetical protein